MISFFSLIPLLTIVQIQGGTYFFSSDVNRLVIGPIERLVELVRKISANPLGVEYKMLGADEGFVDGMETTVLLATITKIGGLMRVGFGEAGAAVIAKNLAGSTKGRLNLMGGGTMIKSIFGFCDVRQFTDTTECLQEEVMLFVNRIAHILHSIVVQCSGAANKNIGDAFLLTWKIDEKYTAEQVSSLADQALLAFCKSLIELSRYQNFIINFSVASTARLYKRFPEYAVRIGSGLHFGWAVEGAIGSDRKIDASYLSPHVSTTEFLESSTKAYGVPLLLSEPFFKLLSPAASRFCRQVDRIRRSAAEEPMGLYCYDSDIYIDWNDKNRHNKKTETMKSRLMNAAKKAGTTASQAPGLPTIQDTNTNTSHSAGEVTGGTPKAATGRRRSVVSANAGDVSTRKQSMGGANIPMVKPQPPSLVGGAMSGAGGATGGVGAMAPLTEEDASLIDVEKAQTQQNDRITEAPTIVVEPYTQDVWMTDADLVELRHNISDSFRALWENGIASYIKGDWQKARDIFHETAKLSKNKDGPTKHLMEVIDEHGGSAPHDWPGYRMEGGGH